MLEVPDLGFKPTVGELVRRAADQWPDSDFVVMPDDRITFAEADSASRDLGKRMLEAGLGKGSRVGIFDTYSIEWVIAWLAALRIGALAMPFSSIYREAELRIAARLGDVHTLLAPTTLLGKSVEDYLEKAFPGLNDQERNSIGVESVPYLRSVWMWGGPERAWATPLDFDRTDGRDSPITTPLWDAVEAEVVPADWAQVTYTSGSSAEPKGVVHSQGAIVRTTGWVAPETEEMMRAAGMLDQTTVLNGFPFFWIGGTLVLGMALHRGNTVCCLPRFEPEAALDMIEREHPKSIMAWPSLIQSIKAHPSFAERDLSSMPALTAPGPSDVALANTPVPGIPAHRSMSELVGNWAGSERKAVDPEGNGEPLPDLEEGELWVRGHGALQAYYKKEREETFDADGWLHTGDRVFMFENRPYFVGRYHEMIKSQGANVSPREVELALEMFPEVEHALVFGVPHDEMGEQVTAVVVFKPGREMTTEELLKRTREDLSSYKVPTRVEVIGDADRERVPWLASGKPDKLKLREMLLSGDLVGTG